MDRLDVDPKERAEVLFLIANHLEMSAALRRDIFNPETVGAFADKVGTPERLKMLVPADLCRHQGGESGGADAVEGRRTSGSCTWAPRTT